ncbi:MAG TPA: mechanosensitive ion channel family protein, partial [Cytophagaceae bacterium]|jgi:small-conductance mechanosensitive channel|nr:mechanosensitive ion channel family protein [Cytophagaceae bacterium]
MNKEEQQNIEEALDDVYGSTIAHYKSKRDRRGNFHAKEKILLSVYLLSLILLLVVHFAFHLDQLPIEKKYLPFFPRLVIGGTLTLLIAIGSLLINIFWIGGISDEAEKHNLQHAISIIRNTALSFVVLSIVYADWYTAFISLGILSIVLGFALQTPILSFIAWIYIIIRKPYKIGDTIQVGEDSGEVVDIDYLDTTVWEIKSSNLMTDHPSGRIIRFPNSNILSTSVFNYSWALFPYIYDEILFFTDYNANFNDISVRLKKIAEEIIGPEQEKEIRAYKEILANTKINVHNINENPEVIFKPSDGSSIQVILLYPVLTKNSGKIKNQITNEILLQNLNSKGIFMA